MNCSRGASIREAITRANWYLGCGATHGVQYNLLWQLMILEWSTLGGARKTFQRNIGRKLQGDYRMGRQKVHLNYIGLGLQVTSSSPFSARIHQESSQTIPTRTAQTSTATVSNSPNKIWRKETICNTRVQSSTLG